MNAVEEPKADTVQAGAATPRSIDELTSTVSASRLVVIPPVPAEVLLPLRAGPLQAQVSVVARREQRSRGAQILEQRTVERRAANAQAVPRRLHRILGG